MNNVNNIYFGIVMLIMLLWLVDINSLLLEKLCIQIENVDKIYWNEYNV